MTIMYPICNNIDFDIQKLVSNKDNQKPNSLTVGGIIIANLNYIQFSIVLYMIITVDVHKCGVLLSQHHPGQPVHRLNTPLKVSQQSWPCIPRHFIMNIYVH